MSRRIIISILGFIALGLALVPMYYAKTTGEFSDYCLVNPEIQDAICRIDFAVAIFLSVIFFILFFTCLIIIYFLIEIIIKSSLLFKERVKERL